MTTPTYTGGMTSWGSIAAWQAAAEEANAQSEAADLTASQDGDAIRLEGETGQTEGFGGHAGEAVPNLSVTRVSKPSVTRGVPSNLTASPLGKGGK